MSKRPLVLCLILIVSLGGIVPGVSAQSGETSTPDNTVIHVYVHENGTAEWVFQTRTRLSTDSDVTTFKDFQRSYQNNSTTRLNSFTDRMTAVASDASAATGREMSVEKFSTRAYIQEMPRRWGVVEFRFFWEGFATTNPEGIQMGDVFAGGWFLSASDTLIIHAPEGYTVESVTPTPTRTEESDTLAWAGELSFSDKNPSVTFVSSPTGVTTPTTDADRGLSLGVMAGGIGLFAIVLLGTTGYVLRRRTSTSGSSEDEAVQSPAPPQTDEERVIELIRQNGGRMKQAAINEEFDWSKSKTSLVISDLADSDKVTKVRLGRENLISLVDSEE